MTSSATGAPLTARSDSARPRPTRVIVVLALLGCATMLAAVATLTLGSVTVPFGDTMRVIFGGATDSRWRVVVLDSRVPLTITAATVGAGLGVAGLQMQTLFRNPLADPYILGASSGASLGVALVVLTAGGSTLGFTVGLGPSGRYQIIIAAAVGAFAVLGIIVLISRWVRSSVTLLLIGVMLGAGTTAAVAVLINYSNPQSSQQFLVWGLGSFTATTRPDLVVLVPVVAVGIALGAIGVRALNALLLGEAYATTMGIRVGRARLLILLSVAVLAGAVTAFCGPIGFLGLVVPHLARIATGSADHRVLLPGSLLVGALMALLCGLIAQMPGTETVLPLGAVTALFGAPVVIAVLVRSRRGTLGAT